MSSRTFVARTWELVGLASSKEMILSNQRKHYPGIGLLTDVQSFADRYLDGAATRRGRLLGTRTECRVSPGCVMPRPWLQLLRGYPAVRPMDIKTLVAHTSPVHEDDRHRLFLRRLL
ncbi:hypothetical protein [Streptomyces hokutonensis]|uniref:hypothetical protein n=1 Tax=Streptomyces hokutonensis TaxID=1306990 RepID=UPI0036821FD7